ncbi:MAG TPA: hypothetical protein VE152_04465 [Acidimicrobiales bacterium]|nr:hypothetical protein [Acidimicrobiales bacterium]
MDDSDGLTWDLEHAEKMVPTRERLLWRLGLDHAPPAAQEAALRAMALLPAHGPATKELRAAAQVFSGEHPAEP